MVLEPNGNPIAGDYQQRLFEANIPITMFGVENVQQTYDALTQKAFTLPLNRLISAKMAIFDDMVFNSNCRTKLNA